MEIRARNINEAYNKGLYMLRAHGIEEESRNGRVISLPESLATIYTHPQERVLFSKGRNANPFFHVMEALWMLAGRNDAAWPKFFNSQMAAYENEIGEFDGAYGYRWRRHFGMDQIAEVIGMLKTDPTTRRAILAMHDPQADLAANTKDQPCNTHIYFRIIEDQLHMTVCCRSNDAIWGAYGANVVHMSMLMELVASMVGVGMGQYVQFSNNFHYYPDVANHDELVHADRSRDVRLDYGWSIMNLVTQPSSWVKELNEFMRAPAEAKQGHNPFFYYVARPMYLSWVERKSKTGDGRDWARQIEDPSWQFACLQWIDVKEGV